MAAKPKILVTGATGRTGAPTVQYLLEQGYPVRAFVHRVDERSDALRKLGAEVFLGDLLSFDDVSRSLNGVQRAYYCPPLSSNLLHCSSVFALAAEATKLEVVALLSQWLPSSSAPSVVTREHWLTNHLFWWMPSVDVIYLNPGLFAFMYMLTLPVTANLGILPLPFGAGENAPPANEDIARVAAAVLMNPEPHLGKTYRPTSSRLLSTDEIAGIFGRILDRNVRYRNVSTANFTKAARAQGVSPFEISQIAYYADELRNGAFALGAPTNHVEEVTGTPAESFEETARRYIANPFLIDPRLKVPGVFGALGFVMKALMTPSLDIDKYLREQGIPTLDKPVPAYDNPGWRESAEREELNFIDPSMGRAGRLRSVAQVLEG